MDAMDRIEAAAKRMGYQVESERTASTGSEYLILSRNMEFVTVRVSDHAEVYLAKRGERRIDVNPEGCSVEQAIAMLADFDSIPVVKAADSTESDREYFRAEREMRDTLKAAWKAFQPRLTDEDRADWARSQSRPTARKVAARHGVDAATAWGALTNGKSYSKCGGR